MIGVDLGAPFITLEVRSTKAPLPGGVRPCTRRAVSGLLVASLAGGGLYLRFGRSAHALRFQCLIGSVALSIRGSFLDERMNKLQRGGVCMQALFLGVFPGSRWINCADRPFRFNVLNKRFWIQISLFWRSGCMWKKTRNTDGSSTNRVP